MLAMEMSIQHDGDFSGGSIERSGLKQLLADVEARKIDIIVIYKVDRLPQSLAGFARIVDILDAQQASFFSVTQSFNSTASMGRLTLKASAPDQRAPQRKPDPILLRLVAHAFMAHNVRVRLNPAASSASLVAKRAHTMPITAR